MKRLHRFLCLIFAILLLSHNICFGQITESFAFPADEMTLTTDTINGVEYCNVSYYDTYNNGDPAEPSLPVKYYTFSIPWNATNISVSADILDYNLIQSPATVFPTQEDQPTDGSNSIDFTLPNSSIYNTNAYFPSNITNITEEGYYLGDNHVITIAIFPIQYNPMSNTLKVNNEINLNITYSLTDIENLPVNIVSRNNASTKAEDINLTKKNVYNPTSVESFATPFSPLISPYTTEPLPMYQYCIITSRELAPAFERLVALKKLKGYDAGIVCMEDIIACENYLEGDVASGNVSDEAGILRAFLSDAFKNGTRYVLLGGKEPHVPIRYGYRHGEVNIPPKSYIPSDLYFANINGDWNYDKDHYFGEVYHDKLDFQYDLIVGRLLCKNIEEVNNYIDKLLIYELNPGNGDYDYLESCFFTFSKSFIGKDDTYLCPIDNQKHNAIDFMNCASKRIFENRTIISQEGNYPTGADVISLLNANPHGYISFHGHGNPNNVTLTDISSYYQCNIQNGICALDNECYFIENTIGDGLDCLTNKFFPSISYSTSCTLMPYDVYSDGETTYNVTSNFGESFILGKGYGGVAFLGSTRESSIRQTTILEREFLTQIFNGIYCIGRAEAESKRCNNTDKVYRLTHNLLGDPEFEIWTDIPVKYTDADIDVYRGEQNIIVSGSCLDGAKIVVHDTNGNVYTKIGSKNNSTYFTSSPNSHIMIYRHNMIPYFAPLLIQNETINSSQYYFADIVNIGSNIDPDRTSGLVNFDSNANWTIEASGDVTLGPGLTLNSGASLTIKTKGKIIVNECTIKSGATLNLEGQRLEIANNLNAQANSNFNYHLIQN